MSFDVSTREISQNLFIVIGIEEKKWGESEK
jgi:hypothetical protein